MCAKYETRNIQTGNTSKTITGIILMIHVYA